MWKTEATIEISVPAQAIYDYLSDLRRHKEWSLGVSEIELMRGEAIEVGAEFKAEERVPMRFASFSRITRLEPPFQIEWKAWDGRTFEVDWAFELVPLGSSTRLTQTAQFQPKNLLGRLLLSLVRKRQIPGENRQSLQRLRQCVEEYAALGSVLEKTS